MPPQASVYEAISTPELWGEERTRDFIRKLSPNLKGLVLGQELYRIGSGEFDLFGPDFGRDFTERFKAQGHPLGWVFPKDAPVSTPTYLSVPTHAAHPNTAKLWINYVLSPEGQEILWQHDFVDHVRVPGSHASRLAQEYADQGYKILYVDVEFARKYQHNYNDVRPELQAIIRRQ